MFWIGSKVDIEVAERQAAAIVCNRPETIDGEAVPASERITARWAIVQPTGDGRYFIPVLDGMDLPSGLIAVEQWPGIPLDPVPEA